MAVVPYSAEQMYALVNDIETYPEFLPWCSDAKITSRGENRLTAYIVIASSSLQQTFSTENTMVSNERIDVRLINGPFKHLNGYWIFEPAGEQHCRIALEMDFEFKNKLIKLALSKLFNHIVNTLVDSFTQSAKSIYGGARTDQY